MHLNTYPIYKQVSEYLLQKMMLNAVRASDNSWLHLCKFLRTQSILNLNSMQKDKTLIFDI